MFKVSSFWGYTIWSVGLVVLGFVLPEDKIIRPLIGGTWAVGVPMALGVYFTLKDEKKRRKGNAP